jgi:D-lactate dehydrogenase (cytochrome)
MFMFSLCRTASLPSVVVYPKSTEDVVQIVKVSSKYRMPITAYSGATSLEGQFRSVCQPFFIWVVMLKFELFQSAVGGICVDLCNMDRILEIHGMYNIILAHHQAFYT